MNGRAKLGVALLAIAIAIWALTPSHVTWGNHHYVKHAVAGLLAGVGLIFLLTGTRN